MQTIAGVEDACAARVTRLSGTPYRLGIGPVPTWRRSAIPMTPLVASALEQHLSFSCHLARVQAREDGESEPEGFITAIGELVLGLAFGIRAGAEDTDYRLGGLAAQDVAGSLLAAGWTADIGIAPTIVYQPSPIINGWLVVESRFTVLFDLSLSS